MIYNESEYNPFSAIYESLPTTLETLTVDMVDMIRRELFKAGVVPESDDELEEIMVLMNDIGLIELQKTGSTFEICKGTK